MAISDSTTHQRRHEQSRPIKLRSFSFDVETFLSSSRAARQTKSFLVAWQSSTLTATRRLRPATFLSGFDQRPTSIRTISLSCWVRPQLESEIVRIDVG